MRSMTGLKFIGAAVGCCIMSATLSQCSSPGSVVGGGQGQGLGGTQQFQGGATQSLGSAGGAGGSITITLPTGDGGAGAGGVTGAGGTTEPSADANCGTQTSNASQQPADVLLVLDRSGSMSDDIATNGTCTGRGAPANCMARWPTMTTALNQVFAASPNGVQWGLKFFASPSGGTCTVNPGVEVPVGPGTATQIETAIGATSPANQTPTTAAINAAAAYLETLTDGLPHFILLATDGQPNCDPGTSGSTTPAVVANTVAAITAAASAGIKTYVIGIGPSAGNLDNFAAAGGTGTYFPATSPAQLDAALSTIVGAVASCVFTMASAAPDPNNIGVYLDKTNKVPVSVTDGYSLSADNRTITLSGSYCDGIKSGTYKLVQVFFGCPGGPPIPLFIP
jgi:hypothetical protein